jgi:hypothetical protein
MSSTIESTNNNILNKLGVLRDLIGALETHGINISPRLKHCTKEISDEYEMGSITLLADYFYMAAKHQSDGVSEIEKKRYDIECDRCFSSYQSFIGKENFAGRMDRLFKKTRQYAKGLSGAPRGPHSDSDVFDLIKQYENSSVGKNIKEVPYESCERCATKMVIIPNASELICEACGNTQLLSGTVFEDDQFYYQEGQRTKHGNYDPTKHCRIWVERIQAREATDIPPALIDKIKTCIVRDRIRDIRRVSCAQIRKYLQQTDNSKYNEHIPLIRKLLTGLIPPQLTDHELQLINIYFDKAIRIFEEVKPPDKTNCPYHPYFIYKIIEQILKPNDSDRKKEILSCIHLQSFQTLCANDIIWMPICARIPEFTYIPTDRNLQLVDY